MRSQVQVNVKQGNTLKNYCVRARISGAINEEKMGTCSVLWGTLLVTQRSESQTTFYITHDWDDLVRLKEAVKTYQR